MCLYVSVYAPALPLTRHYKKHTQNSCLGAAALQQQEGEEEEEEWVCPRCQERYDSTFLGKFYAEHPVEEVCVLRLHVYACESVSHCPYTPTQT
jgi:hypothetical protein